MCGIIHRRVAGLLLMLLFAVSPTFAQQDSFRWMDFHSQKDQDVIVWVTRSLAVEKWSAIREIGVRYDAALVVTTLRANPQALPGADVFTIWSVSLTNHSITPLLKGVNLRMLDWMKFADGAPLELGIFYDNCNDCSADTYFTSFHYDMAQHMWEPRWMRGAQAVPIWTTNTPAGVTLTQVYALMAEPNGSQYMATWNHLDYGNQKPAEDFIYRYDLDPYRGLERTELLSNKDAETMKQRLCRGLDAPPGLARGQDSPMCQQMVKPRAERKPVTTPPPNNHGQSTPPEAPHRH